MIHAEHLSSNISGRAETVRHNLQASIALGVAVLACNMAKPAEAVAHEEGPQVVPTLMSSPLLPSLNPGLLGMPLTNKLPAAAGREPVLSYSRSKPVTMDDVKKYLGIANSYVIEHHVATPQNPKPLCIGKERFRLLPARNPQRDAKFGTYEDDFSDMRTKVRNGIMTDSWGRASANCQIDILNVTAASAEGDYKVCSVLAHEEEHEDDFTSHEPGRDPNGTYPNNDVAHDLNNKSLMYYKGPPDNFDPCVEATVDAQPQSVDTLAHDAIAFIPKLANAVAAGESINCEPAHKRRDICYYMTGNGRMVGRLIKVNSKFSHHRRPDFKASVVPTSILNKLEAGKSIDKWLKKQP